MSSQQSKMLISEAVCGVCERKVDFKPPMVLSRFIGSSTDNYWTCHITNPETGEKEITCPDCSYTGSIGLLYVLTPNED